VAGKCEIEVGANCLIADADDRDVKGCDVAAQAAGYGAAATNGAKCRLETSSFKQGMCINEKCLLTPNGATYPKTTITDATIETFGKVCRANPEADSPFGNDVVENWNVFKPDAAPVDAGAAEVAAAYPYNSRSSFENANVCANGQACTCSYKKLTASGQTGYIEISESADSFARLVAEALGGTTPLDGDLGICSGGAASGAFCIIGAGGMEYGCRKDLNPPTPESLASGGMGVCNPIQREDDLVGLRGYCLERDSAINVNGDQNLGACLTYFPIDELRGETDLYGKDKQAGFFEDAFYCGEVKNYANVRSFRGCSAIRGSSGRTDDNLFWDQRTVDACQYTVTCPSGYWAIVGPRANSGDAADDDVAGMCERGGSFDGTTSDGDGIDLWEKLSELDGADDGNINGCPYMCVPKNSVHTEEDESESVGEACAPPGALLLSKTDDVAGYRTPYVYSATDLGEWEDQLDDCTYYGLDLSQDELGIQDFYGLGLNEEGGDYATWHAGVDQTSVIARDINGYTRWSPLDNRDVGEDVVTQLPYEGADFYPACRSIVQAVDSSNATGYMYTDRIFEGSKNPSTLLTFGQPPYGLWAQYSNKTPNKPFGSTIDPRDLNGLPDPYPATIPTCTTDAWLSIGGATLVPTWVISGAGLIASVGDLSVCRNPFVRYGVPSLVPNFGLGEVIQALPFVTPTLGDVALGAGAVKIYTQADVQDPSLLDLFDGFTEAQQKMEQIFAESISGWRFLNDVASLGAGRGALGSYIEESDFTGWSHDFTFNNRATGSGGYTPEPPTIYAVDCAISSGLNCREGGINQISVNGKEAENYIVDTDGFFRASVEFFAAASKEQLPIRRIIVDWGNGDQSGSAEPDNFYKNHRGLDKNADDMPFCDQKDEWGKTPESCEPTWLRYTKTYVCDDQWAESNKCGVGGRGDVNCYDESANECIFQPKVHVRDNWGWCTGSCPGGTDAGDGCFSAQSLVTSDDLPTNQCNYLEFPSPAHPDLIPWVKYSGTIRIKKN
jgi:hypothetical protein